MPLRYFITGATGFVGGHVAEAAVARGMIVSTLARASSDAGLLERLGVIVHRGELSDSDALRKGVLDADVVVHCASSGRGGGSAYEAVYLNGTQNLLEHFHPGLLIFTSSTSVYSQADASWVDERSVAEPTKETGKILRKAEDLVLASGGSVARLAGLYGPGRCVPLQKLAKGEAVIEGEGERVMNLVHQVDAVSALQILAETDTRGVFNVVDNEPVSQRDWYVWVCEQSKKPLPPYGPRDLTRKRGWTNKRVSNQKLRSLGWKPCFPTFREGTSGML